MQIGNRPLVIIESPYAGDVPLNLAYLKACCQNSWQRGEWPFASHGWFTTFLDDNKPEERRAGIMAGYDLWNLASLIVVYEDLGRSPGMERAIQRFNEEFSPYYHGIEFRTLGSDWFQKYGARL